MAIKLIAAVSKNFGLGKDNELLFEIKEDLSRFQSLTKNNIVLMGNKTFKSIIERNGKPLPKRVTAVLSRDVNLKSQYGEFIYNDVNTVLKQAKTLNSDIDKTVWICGGMEIYTLLLPYVDEIHLTVVDQVVEDADAFYPMKLQHELGFKLKDYELHHSDKYECNYSFRTYARNK